MECDTSAANGNYVTLVGVLKVGRVKALFFVTLMPDSVFMFEGFPGPPPVQHQYVVKAPGVSTLSATGAHVAGDAVDVSSPGGAAYTLHVTARSRAAPPSTAERPLRCASPMVSPKDTVPKVTAVLEG